VAQGDVLVGTSGWQYDDWRGVLYPPKLPKRLWLQHYAKHYPTVEVNNTFYRLPERSTFERWAAETPPCFVITAKASRFLTHIRRLREPEEPVARLLDRLEGLGDRCGPVLVQLPGDFRVELGRLEETLKAFHKGSSGKLRVAVEPRHESWFQPDFYELLSSYDAALCLADRGSRPITPLKATASWGYVRFHAGRANPPPHYGRSALRTWAQRIRQLWPSEQDVYVYFNNDTGGWAVRDADELRRLLGVAR
jgi:uncharacterized protein YecE (DUF72 family)